MKTLKELTEKIAQLQNEMNPACQIPGGKSNHNQPKTKVDVSMDGCTQGDYFSSFFDHPASVGHICYYLISGLV